jgi:predicted extracellular nuclease
MSIVWAGLLALAGCASGADLPQGYVAIGAIQGAGHISPLLGGEVSTVGIVTAVGSNGFYLQGAEGDGDDLTSEGIFVFSGRNGAKPRVADQVTVTGTVDEFIPGGAETINLSVTQLVDVDFSVSSSANPLPDVIVLGSTGRTLPRARVISESELPVNLQVPQQARVNRFNPDDDGIDFYESLEAMRVSIRDPVAVSPTRRHNASSSEVWVVADGGELIEPADARTGRGGIYLQPEPHNRGDHNPERVQVQFDGAMYPGGVPAITVGDRLGDVTGVVGYSFGNFEVNATNTVVVTPSGLEPETTTLVGTNNSITVATYNVENLSAASDAGSRTSIIASQIVHNLRSPDVIGLQEIQDNNGTQGGPENRETDASETLRALSDAVAAAGGVRYEFVDVAPLPNTSGGAPGGNIRNAFLYNPRRVGLRSFLSLTPDVLAAAGARDPGSFDGSRNPLAATFEFGGREVSVICNHLSSRYGSTPVFGAVQPFVQVGEASREAQLQALNAYVSNLIRTDPQAHVVALGDMNTFEFTNDLTEILPGEGGSILVNLMPRLPDDRYTYIFEGNSQVLDHIIVSRNLSGGAEVDVVHVNVDFPNLTEQRASDHEPVVARIKLDQGRSRDD